MLTAAASLTLLRRLASLTAPARITTPRGCFPGPVCSQPGADSTCNTPELFFHADQSKTATFIGSVQLFGKIKSAVRHLAWACSWERRSRTPTCVAPVAPREDHGEPGQRPTSILSRGEEDALAPGEGAAAVLCGCYEMARDPRRRQPIRQTPETRIELEVISE